MLYALGSFSASRILAFVFVDVPDKSYHFSASGLSLVCVDFEADALSIPLQKSAIQFEWRDLLLRLLVHFIRHTLGVDIVLACIRLMCSSFASLVL